MRHKVVSWQRYAFPLFDSLDIFPLVTLDHLCCWLFTYIFTRPTVMHLGIPKYGNDGQFYKTGFQQVRFGEAGPTYGLEKFLGERAEI